MVKKILKGLLLVAGGIGCFLAGYLAKAYDLAGVEGDEDDEEDTDDFGLDDDPDLFDEPVAPPFHQMAGDFDGDPIIEAEDTNVDKEDTVAPPFHQEPDFDGDPIVDINDSNIEANDPNIAALHEDDRASVIEEKMRFFDN